MRQQSSVTPNLYLAILLLVSTTLVFQGCKRNAKEPIERFQKSTTLATTAISSYYNELNPYERNLYLQDVLLDPKKEVLRKGQDGKPTALLKEPFDPRSVQARIALIKQLARYAERLSVLAGNDAPERFSSSVTSLAGSLTTLHGTFSSLSTTATIADASARDYLGPISTLVGVLGNVILEKRRDAAVRTAILNGEAPITQILDFLKADLDKYVKSTRLSGDDQKLANLEKVYNLNKSTFSLEQRRELLKELAEAAEELKITRSSKPSDVMIAMRETHKALVVAAKDPSPVNISSVMSALEAYEDRVQTLIDAVIQLKENHK